MFMWWGPGWIAGLVWAAFWIVIIVVAVLLLRHELPQMHHQRYGEPPALRLLEERYARGEIPREEFLERRAVLLQPPAPPTAPTPADSGPTQPIPPSELSP